MPYTHHIIKWLIVSIFVGVPLLYWPPLRDYTLGPKLLFWQLVMLVILAIWFFIKNSTIHLPKIAIPALLYTLLAVITSPIALHPEVALLETSKILSGLICFFILSNWLNHTNISTLITVSICTATVVALLGFCDFIGWRPFQIPSAGLPSATLGFRNIAAMYTIQTLPFAFALYVLARNRYTLSLSGIALVLLSAFLIYTRTRGAWLGLSLASVVTIIVLYKTRPTHFNIQLNRKKCYGLISLLAIIILFITLPSGLKKQGPQSIDEKKTTVAQTIQSLTQTGGDRGRLRVWQNTLPMLADHPLFGVGLGNWSVHYPKYDKGQLITFQSAPERPHNTFLSIWTELGSIGFIIYLWFCIITLRLGQQLLQAPSAQTRWLAIAGLVSFMAILIHSFFSFPNERITPTLLFWFIPGLFVALNTSKRQVPLLVGKSIICILGVIITLQIMLTWRFIQFDTMLYQAVQSERSGNWPLVTQQTKKALEYGAFHSEALILHGYALNTVGDYPAALSFYQNAIQKRPNDIQLLNGLAIAAQNQKQFDLAHQTYLSALQIADSADTRYNLAAMLLQSGQAKQAAIEYEHVLKVEDPSLDLYYHLALAYFLAHAPQKAQTALKQAFKLMPTQANAHFEWIETLYRRHHNPALASIYYTTFVEFWPGNAQDLNRAQKRLNELKQILP